MASIHTKSLLLSTGATINYTVSGPEVTAQVSDSPRVQTLIFLHFWGGSCSTFGNVVNHLSQEQTCLSISFRGWGSSTAPNPNGTDAYSIVNLASDIRALIIDLSLKSYVLIGHSMGGKVAQYLAGSELPGLSGLILVATAPATPLVLPETLKNQQLLAYTTPQAARFAITNVLTMSNSNIEPEVVDGLVSDMLRGNESAKNAWPKGAILEDVSWAARSIHVPTVVVGAFHDIVEPVERLTGEVVPLLLEGGSKVQTIIIKESGHLIPVEAPERLAEVIDQFVKTLEA